MSTTPAAVRLAIETQVGTTTLTDTSTPLCLSLHPQQVFLDSARSPRHMEYAVGCSSSEAAGDRARSTGTVLCRTLISVSLAFQLPIQDPSMDALLVVENDIRKHLNEKSVSYPVNFQIRWLRSSRGMMAPPGWMYSVSEFEALHMMVI